jgi:iron complex transport system permease protein
VSRRPAPRRATALVLAVAFAGLAALVGVALGPGASIGDAWEALTGSGDETVERIVREFRIPRVGLGLLVGASLALAGVLLQALLRNDLAEPYLVGVGPGAFLGVTAAALLAAGGAAFPGAALRGVFAFAGALLVSVVVFAAARRSGRFTGPVLLLGGLALGAFVSAVSTAVLYVAVPDWERVVYWLLGHLRPAGSGDLLIVGAIVLVGGAAAVVKARELDAVALGEEGAWLVGVDVRRLLLCMGLTACLLAAGAVATSGLIGFVGLLVPHLARTLVGPGHRVLVPAAMALGAGLLVLADAVARVAHPPLEIPVGVVTAALGAPFLAWRLLRPGRR